MFFLIVLSACSSPEEREFQSGVKAAEAGQFSVSLDHFKKAASRNPQSDIAQQAAREGARIAFFELKNYERSIEFYQHLVMYSTDPNERISAQKQIAASYFDHMSDYPKAVVEINRLLPMLQDPKEIAEYKMSIARAYYYQNNFSQAENEADEFLRKEQNQDQRFDMMMLKGNINLADKQLPKAIQVFREVMSKYPEKSKKENVALTLSICYEEMKDFKSAIEVLEEMKSYHPMPEYIDLRVSRMQEKMRNQPGARGRVRK